MPLVITIVVALILVLLALLGAWRGLRRGALAISGTLLGAILGAFWADQWGLALTDRLGLPPTQAIFLVNAGLLLACGLLLGYGGGVLLMPPLRRPKWQRRLASISLGLLNGMALVGYLLRYGARASPDFADLVAQAPLARAIHDGLPTLFLALAALAGATIAFKLLAGLFGKQRPAAPASAVKPGATLVGTLPPGPVRRENQQRTLEKVAEAVDRIDRP